MFVRRPILSSGRSTRTRSIALVVMMMLAGCRDDRHAIASAGASAVPDGAPPPAASALSRFSIPLAYDFTAILPVIEGSVPREFGSMDSVRQLGSDPRKHYAFVADRDLFITFALGREVHIRTTLTYTARGFYKPPIGPTMGAGCGRGGDRPRITVELATPLTVGPNWHLVSHARLVGIEAASDSERDHCSVSILQLDVTDQVVGAARTAITTRLADIDRKLATISLEPRMVGWWGTLTRPIRVTDGVWLIIGAERLLAGQPSGRGHVMTIPVSLDAHPRIVVDAKEPDLATTALPSLGRDSASPGFRVTLDATLDYTTAAARLRAALKDRPFTRAGHTIYLTAVAVAPRDSGRLSIDVTFGGDAAGTLRFSGAPQLDTARHEITVPDLAYDLASDNALINAYSWLSADVLREMLREHARIPFDDALDRSRGLLLQGLNRTIGDVLTLTGTVKDLTLQGLFITRAGLVIRAEATGQARVAIHPR